MFDLKKAMFDLETAFSYTEVKTKQIEALLHIWQESYKKDCDESYAIGAIQDLVFGLIKEIETMGRQIEKIKSQKEPKINISSEQYIDALSKTGRLRKGFTNATVKNSPVIP
ncbi:hypothetical protein OO184_04015 [Photorhabdus sp. APURE]|uniref:hypothetical protein n=1 Tax=Photorhabdus aballayi TaxID=2991723 RepID=UPI00223D92C6|nr:hypothetical protein [Photorhabdus aballayi]MCW7547132.1 hypothetical protein [Photorhabdus aballayi]